MSSIGLRFLTVVVAFSSITSVASGQKVTRIEEDWEVRIIEADSELVAPQFTAVMTPNHNNSGEYFSVEFNHSTIPTFQAGGLQVQSWSKDQVADATNRLSDHTLHSGRERIRWTQYLKLDTSHRHVEFGISKLESNSWVNVDKSRSRIRLNYEKDSLNEYRIDNSSQDSSVSFAGNRVGYMMLVRVRAYEGNKLLKTYEVNANSNRGHAILTGDDEDVTHVYDGN